MRKKTLVLAMVCALIFGTVTTAWAETKSLGKGKTGSTSVTVTGATVYKDVKSGKLSTVKESLTLGATSGIVPLATGTGGKVAVSGYRYITTKITYKFWGDLVAYTKDIDFYRFKNRRIYDAKHVEHIVWVKRSPFTRYIRSSNNGPSIIPWKGHPGSQEVRFSRLDVIRLAAYPLGEFWEIRPTHYHYGYSNGTYRYRTTY